MGVNNLHRVATRQCDGSELNSWFFDYKSDAVTTPPPSHGPTPPSSRLVHSLEVHKWCMFFTADVQKYNSVPVAVEPVCDVDLQPRLEFCADCMQSVSAERSSTRDSVHRKQVCHVNDKFIERTSATVSSALGCHRWLCAVGCCLSYGW